MRYLLDTHILSNFTKPAPSETLITWMAEQSDDDLFIASLPRFDEACPTARAAALTGRGNQSHKASIRS